MLKKCRQAAFEQAQPCPGMGSVLGNGLRTPDDFLGGARRRFGAETAGDALPKQAVKRIRRRKESEEHQQQIADYVKTYKTSQAVVVIGRCEVPFGAFRHRTLPRPSSSRRPIARGSSTATKSSRLDRHIGFCIQQEQKSTKISL